MENNSVKNVVSKAFCKGVKGSPYKLRPLATEVRGQRLDKALAFLFAKKTKGSVIVRKLLMSAWANAKVKRPELQDSKELLVSLIKVDQASTFKYRLPGAMGREVKRKMRFSHLAVELGQVELRSDNIKES